MQTYVKASLASLLCAAFAFSCGSGTQLLPESERTVVWSGTTTRSKDLMYTEAQVWFAKQFRDSRAVIRYSERTPGRIVGKAYVTNCALGTRCVSLGASVSEVPVMVSFTMDFAVKDGSYKLSFEDVQAVFIHPVSGEQIVGPTTYAELDQIKALCIEPLLPRINQSVLGLPEK